MLLSVVALALTAPAGAANQQTGGVRVVHGLRGVVADVYLDDGLVLQTFQPERSTDLLRIGPGSHRVDVRLAGAPASSPSMLSGTFDIKAGQEMSAVVHLSANGQPELSEFVDDAGAVSAGQTRVVVRHTAAAPPIDVRLDAASIAAGLANPGQSANQVKAGTYQVAVTQAGTPQVLAPAQTVPLAEGTANNMYLIGDQGTGTLSWIAVQTAGLQSAPTAIQTGDSGLADAEPRPTPAWPAALGLGLGAMLLGGSVAGRRIRAT